MMSFRKKKSFISEAWPIVATVIMLCGLFYAFIVGIAKQEEIDCYKWQRWEKEYRTFQISSDMVSQCGTLGINLTK